MHYWLITVGEPLPRLSNDSRLWRTGMLAEELVRRGHRVTWWTSRVDHFHKRFFAVDGETLELATNYRLRFLDGRLYRRNLSLDRLLNHWQIGRQFRQQCRRADRPDAILCSFPTIELSAEAVRFGREAGIPVVLDIRDLWPDIFLQPAPRPVKPLARLALSPYFSATRRALSSADALIAVSAGYLSWGLARADRAARLADRVFPLAYSLPEPTPETIALGNELRRQHDVDPRSLVCLFAGTLGRTYDLGPVIEAARRLEAHDGRRFHFFVCGEGERSPEWRAAASALTNVTFTGWLDQARMRAALACADIGLAAYAAGAPQGLPNKVIEYLAAGLPLVSTLAGETEALLASERCGITVRSGDEMSLVTALNSLGDDTARASMAAAARQLYEARFRAETIYGQLADHLEELAQRRAGDGTAESRSAAPVSPARGTL